MIPAAEVNRHEGGSRFDQSPGEQGALSPVVSAIAITQPGVFHVQIEGGSGGGAGDELVSLLSEAIQDAGLTGGLELPLRLIEVADQRAAIFEPFQCQALGEVEILHLVARCVRVAARLHRVELMPEEVRSEVARHQPDAGCVGNGGVGRHALGTGADFPGDDGAEAGELAGIVHAVDAEVFGGQHPVAAGEVVARIDMQRTDDGELVHHPGLLGEQFGDLDARHVGVDRLPQATVLDGGLGLHVVHIEVARAAIEPDQNNGGGLLARGLGFRLFPCLQELWQTHAGHARHPELQKAPPGEAIAIALGFAEIESEHGFHPSQKVYDLGRRGLCLQ